MQELEKFIHEQLNNTQRSAVQHLTGPLLVLAGAGSGKTRVITTRIAYLIEKKGVASHNILALTFTNKAAAEMKERVNNYLGFEHALPFIGTFHSYCVRLLKQYQDFLPYPFESILDEDDKRSLIDQIMKRTNLNKQLQARTVSYLISQEKNKSITHRYDTLREQSPLLPEIWRAYEKEKQASKCYDFDDLLATTARLFSEQTELRLHHQARVQHILVDEYQDTNAVQNTFLSLLSQSETQKFALTSLCAVGDEDQSIYSWRGATVENIINFPKQFPGTTVIKIEQNFRSVQPILHTANAIIAHNTLRTPKQLWSEQAARDRIRTIKCTSERHEADIIAKAIVQLQEIKQKKIGVLYRSHHLSRSIEEALFRASIPYKIIGNTQFYERKEVKDILAYAKLALNPFDRTAFLRCINCPSRGLGTKFTEQFFTQWDEHPSKNAFDIGQSLMQEKVLSASKLKTLTAFMNIFELINVNDNAVDILKSIVRATNYIEYLTDYYSTADAQGRIENVRELISAAQYAAEQNRGQLRVYLEDIALVQEANTQEHDTDPVLVMTVHAAKGLEFDAVIIAGVEQGIFPGSQSLYEAAAIEEERRLFYVAVTRARNYLLLTHCDSRYRFGKVHPQQPSQFVSEMPTRYTQSDDLEYTPNYQINRYLRNWLGKKSSDTGITFLKEFSFAKPFEQSVLPATPKPPSSMIKKSQPVKHDTFGIGIVKAIQTKSDGQTIITVTFKHTTKRINAQFLQPL